MIINFKGGKTNTCLSLNLEKKTYTIFNGVGSNLLTLMTQNDLRKLEVLLIQGGFKNESD